MMKNQIQQMQNLEISSNETLQTKRILINYHARSFLTQAGKMIRIQKREKKYIVDFFCNITIVTIIRYY